MHVMLRYARTVWQFARPKTLVVVWLHLVFGYELLADGVPSVWKILLALLAIAAWYVHAVAVNDLSDEEVDRLNLVALGEDGDRPIINGTASSRQTRHVAYVAGGVTIVASVALQWQLGCIAVPMLGLNAAYSLPPVRISARGGLAQLLLPLGYVGIPASVAAALAGALTGPFLIANFGLYLLFMGRLFLKDIRDETGDRATGKRTFLVRHGLVLTVWQSGLWGTAGMLVSLYAVPQDLLPLFAVILMLATATTAWNLRRCLREPRLEYALLRVAIVGRVASAWLFCLVLAVTLQQYRLGLVPQFFIVCAAVLMFAFGIVSLFEERSTVKRRLEAAG